LQLLSFEILIWKKAKLWTPWVASLRFRRREQKPAVPRSQTACGLPSSHWRLAMTSSLVELLRLTVSQARGLRAQWAGRREWLDAKVGKLRGHCRGLGGG
jgi:hypothetical protein